MARWKGESAMRESSSMGFVHLSARKLDEKRIRSSEAAMLSGLTTFVAVGRYASFAGAGLPRSASSCAIRNRPRLAAMKKPARGGLIQSAGVQGLSERRHHGTLVLLLDELLHLGAVQRLGQLLQSGVVLLLAGGHQDVDVGRVAAFDGQGVLGRVELGFQGVVGVD